VMTVSKELLLVVVVFVVGSALLVIDAQLEQDSAEQGASLRRRRDAGGHGGGLDGPASSGRQSWTVRRRVAGNVSGEVSPGGGGGGSSMHESRGLTADQWRRRERSVITNNHITGAPVCAIGKHAKYTTAGGVVAFYIVGKFSSQNTKFEAGSPHFGGI